MNFNKTTVLITLLSLLVGSSVCTADTSMKKNRGDRQENRSSNTSTNAINPAAIDVTDKFE